MVTLPFFNNLNITERQIEMVKQTSHNHSGFLNDAINMTPEDVATRYNLDIADDGSVWDSFEGREFKCVYDWAVYAEDQEQQTGESEFVHPKFRKSSDQ